MIKILFVCHGNICRSPMAEFVMKDLVKRAGVEDQFRIESAATSSEEIWGGIGNPVYPPARKKLAEHGLSCSGKRARQITRQDYNKYDLIIGMDQYNLRNINHICGRDDKTRLLMEYAGESRDVADPWYTGDFDSTWDDVVRGCTALLEHLGYGDTAEVSAENKQKRLRD